MDKLFRGRRNASIRKVIISVFMIAMLITISVIGYLVFSSWLSSAKSTTQGFAEEMNGHIYKQIYSFLNGVEQINESNQKIIANGILQFGDQETRDKFFTGVLSAHDERFYSFSCGIEDGRYYGARRNEDGLIEIMRNDSSTGGDSWYYSVNEDSSLGPLALKAGEFDPRTRDWYKKAVQEAGPVFSPIYKHFVMDDLTISHAYPIYNKDGDLSCVLGIHILLKDLGIYLEDAVGPYDGLSVIIEKDTDDIIANSIGEDNYELSAEGNFERHNIRNEENRDIQGAYLKYKENLESNFFYKGIDQNFFINAREIHLPGLDWVAVSAIPEAYLIGSTYKAMYMTAFLSILLLFLSFLAYTRVTKKLFLPMDNLLHIADAFSSGDLSRRIEVLRNDEIGGISRSFNDVAEKMQFLVNNLETAVSNRTEELHKANEELEESKGRLQLILDSAAEAIYGIDVRGNCTFCNKSSLKILGYEDQQQLLGHNMHWKIHHSRRDGSLFPIEECTIFQTFIEGKGSHVEDEVFWRADGTFFDVEYYSYPQIKNGEIIGAVVTFMDISDRKEKEARIRYLSCHDTLTGLYNRTCFEEHRGKIDKPENLPLSVIFADINGLKMTNDIFGHAAGDELIIKTSKILKEACRQEDIIARIGGDEFIILLPKTNKEEAQKVLNRIRDRFSYAKVRAIKCSTSLGLYTKTKPDQSLENIMTSAENAMYKDKTVNRNAVNKDIIDTIIDTLHHKNPLEREHSINASNIAVGIGRSLDLSESDINRLRRAAYLHDIGKIVLDDDVLSHEDILDEDDTKTIRKHAVVGYRILNLFDETVDLAEYAYTHHERWDGKGYPQGLKGEQIPLFSRIISVAEVYDRALHTFDNQKEKALGVIKKGMGTRFDPEIVELFLKMPLD